MLPYTGIIRVVKNAGFFQIVFCFHEKETRFFPVFFQYSYFTRHHYNYVMIHYYHLYCVLLILRIIEIKLILPVFLVAQSALLHFSDLISNTSRMTFFVLGYN